MKYWCEHPWRTRFDNARGEVCGRCGRPTDEPYVDTDTAIERFRNGRSIFTPPPELQAAISSSPSAMSAKRPPARADTADFVNMYTRSTVYRCKGKSVQILDRNEGKGIMLRATGNMHVVALLAQKGGVGKTSIALALAVEAVDEGRTVVVLDADPQASACKWRDRREADAPVVTDVQPSRLRHAVNAAAEQDVDLVVIDTPPRSETAALEAAKVADLVVIPCRAQILDIETVPIALQLLALAGDPTVVSVLNSVPPRGPRAQQATEALERFGVRVCPHMLGHRAAWGDANALGLTVTEYPVRSRAGVELRQVARWLAQVLAQPDMLKGASAHASSS
ncbi:MAG: ParA family protein [Rhodospirillales bacterium]|nr:ParA family protein [Rhodospirillales bacterium]